MQNNPLKNEIIGIIQDSIIWDRVNVGMLQILNSFSPQVNKHEFYPDYKYNGYETAFNILKLEEDTKEKFAGIYSKISSSNSSDAAEVAKTIFNEWSQCFSLQNKKSEMGV